MSKNIWLQNAAIDQSESRAVQLRLIVGCFYTVFSLSNMTLKKRIVQDCWLMLIMSE